MNCERFFVVLRVSARRCRASISSLFVLQSQDQRAGRVPHIHTCVQHLFLGPHPATEPGWAISWLGLAAPDCKAVHLACYQVGMYEKIGRPDYQPARDIEREPFPFALVSLSTSISLSLCSIRNPLHTNSH